VLAHGVEINVFDDNQLVAIIGGIQRDVFTGIGMDAGECFFVELGNPLRRSQQSFPVDVLADSLENQRDALDDLIPVDRSGGPVLADILIRLLSFQ